MAESSIEAAIRANPAEVTQWAVYADWLESSGDPRGSLMSLMLEQERTPVALDAAQSNERRRLMQLLTPRPLLTMVAREKSLAPVFRRGMIWCAGALDGDDLDALINHPSCALLDRAVLRTTPAVLAQWATQLGGRTLPWRTLELETRYFVATDLLDLRPWIRALPQLERLVITTPSIVIENVLLDPMPRLESVNATHATPKLLEQLSLNAPNLERLELFVDTAVLRSTRNSVAVEALTPWLTQLAPRLTAALVEGEIGPRLGALLANEPKVVARTRSESSLPNVVPSQTCFEQAFVIARHELPSETVALVTDLGRETGTQRLVARQASWSTGFGTVEVLRLQGTGEPVLPHQVARLLSQRHRGLDVVAFALSNANSAVQSWSFGPHRRARPEVRIRRDESFSFHDSVLRELVEAMIGFDPGPGLFEALAVELDLATPRLLLGDAGDTDVFTELARGPSQHTDEPEDDELDGDEDDDEDYFDDEREEEEARAWGPAPEPPNPFLAEPTPFWVVQEERVLPGGFADDPAEDDEPAFDATTADAAEVLEQGPVELAEHHQGSTGDPLELVVNEEAQLVASACERCHSVRETRRCARCGDEVCRACAGAAVMTAWEDEKAFACLECAAPRALRVVPR